MGQPRRNRSPVVQLIGELARELLQADTIRHSLWGVEDAAGALLQMAWARLWSHWLKGDRFEQELTPWSPGDCYQELLAFRPRLDLASLDFQLVRLPGAPRKTTGSFYTPACLVERLLTAALDPVLEQVARRRDAESALLRLRILDPACGDGRFLLPAGQRIASVLARRGRIPIQDALSRVVTSCLFGVDRDPLAVALCQYRLTQAGGDPARLAEHIRSGNSLIGVLPPTGHGDPDTWTSSHLDSRRSIEQLLAEHRFFHWLGNFAPRFDVVLGNPPWERVKFQQRERQAAGDVACWQAQQRQAVELSRFLRSSGRFPLSARGDLNHYGPFVETCRQLVCPGGWVGLVVPSGLATDVSLKDLFQDLLERDLVSWFDFHNRRGLFPGVQGNIKFGLLTLGPRRGKSFISLAQLGDPVELDEPGRAYRLAPENIALVNPNTLHCPPFTSRADAALVERIHKRLGILIRDGGDNPWNVRPWTMFHMTKDAGIFHRQEAAEREGWEREGNQFRRGEGRLLPLYEAKLIGQFTHRAATFAGVPEDVRFRTHARTRPLADATEAVCPRYWVAEEAVQKRAGKARWHLGFRNAISAVADSRSLVAAIVPGVGVGNSLPLLAIPDARRACVLLALLNSLVLDYVLRQKSSGGNLNFHVLKQLPVPRPAVFSKACPWARQVTLQDWIVRRVLELVYSTTELSDFARECGHTGPPFSRGDEERRLRRAELDVACFHLYGLTETEVERVLDSFAILERRERKQFGRFHTGETIRQMRDRMKP